MLHQARQTLVRQDTQAPRDQGCNRAAPARGMMERHDELPGPSLPNDQEQERGF